MAEPEAVKSAGPCRTVCTQGFTTTSWWMTCFVGFADGEEFCSRLGHPHILARTDLGEIFDAEVVSTLTNIAVGYGEGIHFGYLSIDVYGLNHFLFKKIG
jgi:hypothetical protein